MNTNTRGPQRRQFAESLPVAKRDPIYDMEIKENGMPSGRIIHRITRQVLARDPKRGYCWQPVSP